MSSDGMTTHLVIEPVVPAHPHHIVALAGLPLTQVHCVELVGGEGPELTVSEGGLGHQRVGQLGERGEAEVRGLGRQPAPAGQ